MEPEKTLTQLRKFVAQERYWRNRVFKNAEKLAYSNAKGGYDACYRT